MMRGCNLRSWGLERWRGHVRPAVAVVRLMIVAAGALALVFTAACVPEADDPPVVDSVLRLSDVGPITLDPAVAGEMSSHVYITHLYSGLVTLNEDLQVEGDIAQDWTVSDDGTRYVFELRDDVRFHSGRAVTAADFKYSWERACDPATGSGTAPIYLGDIVGAQEMLAGEATELSGVSVLDEHTLQVDIVGPRSYFLYKMTYTTAYVVDHETVAGGPNWWREPNGTGPFSLARWEEGNILELRRNPDYHGTPALLDAVEFHLLAGVPMMLYEQGHIDVVSVHSAYMDIVTDPANPVHEELMSTPELSLYYIGFDVTRPPFDDVYVRLAFCHAVDRDRIVSILFRDGMTRAGGLLPKGLPGYDPDLDPYTYDPDLARKLLQQSSYGSAEALPPISITLSGYANQVPSHIAAALHGWKEHLDVEVSVRQLEPEAFLYHIRDERDEMYSMGWIADYPDPHNFLGTLFTTGESYNISGYNNPEFEALLQEAAAEMDENRRLELYRQAEQLAVEDPPCLPLMYGVNHVLVKPYVSGYQMNAMGVPDLAKVSVERP